jgi:hypothetical protein
VREWRRPVPIYVMYPAGNALQITHATVDSSLNDEEKDLGWKNRSALDLSGMYTFHDCCKCPLFYVVAEEPPRIPQAPRLRAEKSANLTAHGVDITNLLFVRTLYP